jgi:hypothetical protein
MASVSSGAFVRNPADLPKSKEFGVHVVRITPDLAGAYLSFNRNNRALSDSRVDEYSEEMTRGAWKENGDTIRFSKTGKLLDGQHRLTAIVRSGTTQRMFVAVGLDDETQVTVDTGKKRAPSDVLSIEGLEKWESANLGAAMHAIINVTSGAPWHSTVRRTNHEVRDFWLEHPRLGDSLRLVKGLPRTYPPIHHSKAIALHYFFAMRDAAQADAFMTDLFTGANLSASDAVYHLRERLIAARVAKERVTPFAMCFAVIKAWNARRKGRRVSSGRSLFPRTGDEFPAVL